MVIADDGGAGSEDEKLGLEGDVCKGEEGARAVGGLHDDGDGSFEGIEGPFDGVVDGLVIFGGRWGVGLRVGLGLGLGLDGM